MADPFKKVQAGQSLDVSAQAWNAFLDNARANKGKQHDQLADPPAEIRQADIIKVRNDTGQDCGRFSVLGLGAPIISPQDNLREFKNNVALKAITPSHPEHFGRFVVLLEPLRNGKIGRAWISGVCPAYVYVEDACHEFADVADGEVTALISRPVGSAKILWRQGGLGFQWAVVRLSNVANDVRRFKLNVPLSRCGSASAQRITYSGLLGNQPTWCATDCGFTVHDSVGVVGDQPAKAGSFGWAKWMADSNRWEVLQLGEGCCGQPSSSSSSSESSSSESSSSSSDSSESSSSASSSSGSSTSSSGSSSSGSSGSASSSSNSRGSSDSGSSSSFSNSGSSGSNPSGSGSSGSQFSSSEESSSGFSSSGFPSASEVSVSTTSASVPSSSGFSSSAPGDGGLTGSFEVLIRCPIRDGDTVTFPAQRMNFVNGRLQSIESASPCSFSVADS